MQADVLMTIPWYDDDDETWHQNHVWGYYKNGRTTYSISDECGDHEPLDEPPSAEEHEQAWREYTQWAIETGQDPLDNFYVRQTSKVKERWQFWLFKSLTGPRLDRARRAGKEYKPQDLPGYVKSYLNLTSSNNLGDFKTWDELVEALPGIKPSKWTMCHLEQERERSEVAIARDVRRGARKALIRRS